jgi:DNA-directed RNA polymerase subunit M/transcription elongation factor TFIIS
MEDLLDVFDNVKPLYTYFYLHEPYRSCDVRRLKIMLLYCSINHHYIDYDEDYMVDILCLMETNCYNFSISKIKHVENQSANWENKNFENLYSTIIRDYVCKLYDDKKICQMVTGDKKMAGSITTLDYTMLLNDIDKKILERKNQEISEKYKIKHKYLTKTCPYCKEKKVIVKEKQVRSGDEGKTEFHFCTLCLIRL